MNEMNFVVSLTVQLEVCVAVTKAEVDEMEGQVEERGLIGSMTTAQLVAYDKVVEKLPGEPVRIEDWSVSPVFGFESLPADECFTIRHISRGTLAELCNDYLETHGFMPECVASDDARLTSTICKTYAAAMTKALSTVNYDDQEEMEQNAIAEVVAAMGIIIPDTN